MTLTTNISQLAERIAEEFKTVRVEIANSGSSDFSGDYNDLTNQPDLSGYATTTALSTGLATKADAVAVYTKPEVDAAIAAAGTGGGGGGGDVDHGDITFDGYTMSGSNGRIRNAVTLVTSLGDLTATEGVEFSTAVLENDTITFSGTTQELVDTIRLAANDINSCEVTIDGVVVPVFLSGGYSITELPEPVIAYLSQSMLGGPHVVTALRVSASEATTSFLEIRNADLTANLERDVRITGKRRFTFANLSTSDPIKISTSYGDYAWEFGADGHLILPLGGEIRDEAGNTLLGGGGGGGVGASLPSWVLIEENITGSMDFAETRYLPNGMGWMSFRETYKEIGFLVVSGITGAVAMTVLPAELLPSNFQTSVSHEQAMVMLCIVNDAFQGEYALFLENGCFLAIYAR